MDVKKERKKWGMILFTIFIMIGTSVSFVFFGFQPQSEVIKYQGIKFVNKNDVWIAKINGKEAAFSFLPSEVEGISAEEFSPSLRNKLEIDVTYDLNTTYRESIALAQHQMGLTLQQYGTYVRKGFTTNNTFGLPLITCADSTASVPVIYFRYGNVTKVHIDNTCIIADASSNIDFIRIKDRLLYGMLEVLK